MHRADFAPRHLRDGPILEPMRAMRPRRAAADGAQFALFHARRPREPRAGVVRIELPEQVPGDRHGDFAPHESFRRRAVRIAHPDADRVFRIPRHRPGVAQAGGGARLPRHRRQAHVGGVPRRVQRAFVAGQDVADQPAGFGRKEDFRRRRLAGFDEPRRQPAAAAREARVGVGEVQQAHLRVAQHEPEAVVRRRLVDRAQAQRAQRLPEPFLADAPFDLDGGQVQRGHQGVARGDQPAAFFREIARIQIAKAQRHVGDRRRGRRQAAIERQRVGEGLERRARRARRHGAVDLARAAFGEIVRRARQRAHRAGLHFQHHHRPTAGWAVREVPPQNVLRPPLQVAVERRAHGRVRTDRRRHADQVAEMRRAEGIRPGPRDQRLRQRFRALAGRDEPARLHPLQHVRLPLLRRFRMPVRPQARRRLRHARQQRRLGQAQVRRAFAKVAARRRLDAHQVAAERRAVQVLGQNLALAKAPLELQGAKGLDGLRRQRPAPGFQQADHLRGNRRGARHAAAAGDVLRDGAAQRPDVHARMRPEPAILRRHQRLRDPVVRRGHVARPAVEAAGGQLHPQRLAAAVRQHGRTVQPRQFFRGKRRPAHRRGERRGSDERRADAERDSLRPR